MAAAPQPKPTPTPKKPQISDAARALAEGMRRFDSGLSAQQMERIAEGINYNLSVGERVNPHGTALKNWDEPVTIFEVSS